MKNICLPFLIGFLSDHSVVLWYEAPAVQHMATKLHM